MIVADLSAPASCSPSPVGLGVRCTGAVSSCTSSAWPGPRTSHLGHPTRRLFVCLVHRRITSRPTASSASPVRPPLLSGRPSLVGWSRLLPRRLRSSWMRSRSSLRRCSSAAPRTSNSCPTPRKGGPLASGDGRRALRRYAIRTCGLASGCATTVNFFTFMSLAIIILFASSKLDLSPGVIGLVFGIGATGGLSVRSSHRESPRGIGVGRSVDGRGDPVSAADRDHRSASTGRRGSTAPLIGRRSSCPPSE